MKRRALYIEQRGLCYYCQGPMVFIDVYPSGAIKNMITLEHLIIPVLGQSKKGAKVVAACADCNQGKAREYEKIYIEEHRQRSNKNKR
jgi:hypothetical protein